MEKPTAFLIVIVVMLLSLLGWDSAYHQHNRARYWEGRAEREIERANAFKRVATHCTDDLRALRADNAENRTELARVDREAITLSASLDSCGARAEAFESAVRRHCLALAREIMNVFR